MAPHISVTVADSGPQAGDQLRALRSWLSDVEGLRGQVRVHASESRPGTLGILPDTLVVVGPIVAALVPALISWIRSRNTEVSLELTRPDGTKVTIAANQVRGVNAKDLPQLIDGIVRSFSAAPQQIADAESVGGSSR